MYAYLSMILAETISRPPNGSLFYLADSEIYMIPPPLPREGRTSSIDEEMLLSHLSLVESLARIDGDSLDY